MSELETPVEAPTAPPARKVLPVQKLASHISTGGLYKIWIGNILLNIITLGIYSFWGRTRLRKYSASHITLAGSPFEYTGTGGELFGGFLKAYLVLIVFFGVVGVLMNVHIALGLLLELLLIPLIYAGIYLSFRYRLSRLKWKAIRLGLGGTVKDFIKETIGAAFLSLITLGILLPKIEIKLWGGLMNNAHFGSQQFEFRGDYKKLMGIHLLTLLGGIAILAAIGGIIAVAFAASFVGTLDKDESSIVFFIVLLLFPLARIPRCWYQARLWQAQLMGLRLGELRFKSKATGTNFFMLGLGNFLILLFTLGLGYPFVIKRRLEFQTKYTIIAGELNEAILQAPKQATGIGDAMSPDIDFSGGMDLGL